MQEPRTARSRRTRERLVSAVRDELRRTATFNADNVAEAAGCSVATFYVHFPTKDDALAQAFELTIAELVSVATKSLSVEKLHEIGVDMLFEDLVRDIIGFFRREALTLRAGLARIPDSKVVRDIYRDADREMIAAVSDFVHSGQTDGVFPDCDASEVAQGFLVVAQGLNNAHALRDTLSEESIKRFAAAMRAVVVGA